jgi:hypothetical protein
MKQKNFLKIALLFTIAIISNQSYSQVLNTGDIAFIGYHEDANDQFTWITLTDIPAGEEIYFTDQGWNATGSAWFTNSEDHMLYTAPIGGLSCGTIIHIEETTADTFTVTGGGTATTDTAGWSLSSGDQILAYRGGSGKRPAVPVFLSAIQNEYDPTDFNATTKWNNGGSITASAMSMLPLGLTNGTNCISINADAGVELDNSRYTGTLTGTSDAIRASINNISNWTRDGITIDITPSIYLSPSITCPNLWRGTTNTDWGTTTNWSKGSLPIVSQEVEILEVTNAPIISSTTGAVSGNLTITEADGLLINSGGSLIVNGTSSGNITYRVEANDMDWHLLSSPVVAAAYNGTWITDNDIDDTTRTVGTNVAIGAYTNTVDADGDWAYATDAANSGTFTSGQGYSIKRDATTNSYVSFTGTLKIDDLTNTINQNTNNWNLKGNPYTAYILVSDLISDNSGNLTGTHNTVYVWDNNKVGGAGYSALTGTDYIYPGQGFFVNAANSDADNFTIDVSKLSHQTGKTLYKGSTKTAINLMISDGNELKYTEINYSENMTVGLDPSFDIGTFTGASTSFSVYSELVEDNNGVDFMRQSLPNSNHENMVIPIGINAASGKEITFTAEAQNLPSGINVYLEDRETNTFTQLNETNSEYKLTLSEEVNGIGRFYLHAKSSVLTTYDVALENVSIYKTNNETLRIIGLSQGKSNVKLFNILGKQMMNTSFNSNGVKDINLPKLATGVYVVQLENENGKLNKKIILE